MSTLFEQASLVMIPSGYKEDVVYSVKPTDGSGDLTFTRASDGTRVNSQGLVERVPWNLLEQSNSFSIGWTTRDSSVTSGQNGYDGSNDAWRLQATATAAFARVERNVTASSINTLSVYAKAGNVDFLVIADQTNAKYYDLANGTLGNDVGTVISSNIKSVGGGWYRCEYSTSTSITNYRIYVSNANGSVAINSGEYIYIQDAQLNEGSTAKPYFPTTDRQNVPRLDYSGGCPSLLLEPQRTNLVTYSEQFDNAAWINSFSTITANYGISPDGTQNADRYQRTAGTRGVIYTTISVSSGTTYTLSMYAKSLNGTQKIRIGADNGCVTPQGAETFSVGETWTRIETQITSTQTSWNVFFDNIESGTTCTGTYLDADFLVWGFQCEAGSYPTSYIPTTSASVTRVADVASKTGISSLIGQTEGTFFVEATIEDISSNHTFLRAGVTSSFSNSIIIEMSAGVIYGVVYVSSVAQCLIGSPTQVEGNNVKIALAYKANDFALYINGVQIGTDNSGSVPSSVGSLWVGNNSATEQTPIKQALLFPTRLTNTQLAELTTL